jgi:predicted ArsR family transcriptional regulator
MYAAVDRDAREGRDYRLLAEILVGLVPGVRGRERATALAREWGQYLTIQGGPKPGTRLPAGRNLAVLQEAMAEAGFDPRFRRAGRGIVQITLRDCPFRDLLEDHRALVCDIHRGLVEGMLGALKPPLALTSFQPLAERTVCRLEARAATSEPSAPGASAGTPPRLPGPGLRVAASASDTETEIREPPGSFARPWSGG